MAITTYAELQTAAANWLIRGDLTARIPEFITLAEARLNRVLRARLAESDQALTATLGSRTIVLPTSYSTPQACWVLPPGASDRTELEFQERELMPVSTATGQPYYWTIDGANLAFERPCDQAYAITLGQFGKFALSNAVPTNGLLTNAPDVYLFATLCEAGPFLRDADLTSAYEAKLDRAVSDFNSEQSRARSLAKLQTEPAALQRGGRGYNIATDRF
jgi:hypothetical protein